MKLLRMLSLSAMLLLAAACHKDPKADAVPGQSLYVGTVSVDYNGGTYDNNDIYVAFRPSDDGRTAEIVIYRIKFVPAMPVTIDVSIPGISVQGDAFSCDNVIPWALGGEYPKYTVHDLEGTVAGETLSFSLLFGDYPTRFTGRLERE